MIGQVSAGLMMMFLTRSTISIRHLLVDEWKASISQFSELCRLWPPKLS
jgi:hypothetical protein